jgi:pseudouridine kinase
LALNSDAEAAYHPPMMEISPNPTVICIGGALTDRKYRLKAAIDSDTSNPAVMTVGFGGVARNVAETLARLGVRAALAAAVGDDAAGGALRDGLAALGVDVSEVRTTPDEPTADYAAVLDGATGRLHFGVVSMDGAERHMEQRMGDVLAALPAGAIVFADANLTARALEATVAAARSRPCFLALDAVSIAKASRLPDDLGGVGLVVMNEDEAAASLGRRGPPEDQAQRLVARGAAAAVVTRGSAGAVLADALGVAVQPALRAQVRDVTGAGDSLIAAMLWRISLGEPPRDALRWGVAAAGVTTESAATVHPAMSAAFLRAALSRMPQP